MRASVEAFCVGAARQLKPRDSNKPDWRLRPQPPLLCYQPDITTSGRTSRLVQSRGGPAAGLENSSLSSGYAPPCASPSIRARSLPAYHFLHPPWSLVPTAANVLSKGTQPTCLHHIALLVRPKAVTLAIHMLLLSPWFPKKTWPLLATRTAHSMLHIQYC